MSLVVNHNLMAANVARNLNQHYGNLSTSTQRLSTGLRVNSAADDAAGLAIRELMRADIASFHQGARNANDAISMIQVADGALSIIDEKLIRMKELAEQAATGTYDSTQRLMIDSEFQQMASEINRIAVATDFNGIKLIDGNYKKFESSNFRRDSNNMLSTDSEETSTITTSGISTTNLAYSSSATLYMHYKFDNDFSDSTGNYSDAIPANQNVSFDTGHDNQGIHLTGKSISGPATITNSPPGGHVMLPSVDWSTFGSNLTLSIWVKEEDIVIPEPGESYVNFNGGSSGQYGSDNQGFVEIYKDDVRDQIQYRLGGNVIVVGNNKHNNDSPVDAPYLNNMTIKNNWVNHVMTLDNGVFSVYQNGQLVYKKTGVTIGSTNVNSDNNAIGRHWWDGGTRTSARLTASIDDLMLFSGALNENEIKELYDETNPDQPSQPDQPDPVYPVNPNKQKERSGIPDNVVKIHFGSGNDSSEDYYYINKADATISGLGLSTVSIETQDKAQHALIDINNAIVKKDNIRAYYGAMQNRLENTISNITIQAENLQASESRISDVDVATEMTEFVRNQILTQSAVAMLSQANSLPQMALQLIGG